MKINRELQKSILLKLAEIYPYPNGDSLLTTKGRQHFGWLGHNYDTLLANLFYLQEHDLVTGLEVKYVLGGESIEYFGNTRLTHKGLDFLLDDGGLSSILGTITVKFHEDTIKSLLSAKIKSSNLPIEEKSTLLRSLKSLSGKALEQVITKLVDLGFDNADQAIHLLKTVFESLQRSAS